MKLSELTELHYITPIANAPSILQKGILSYKRAGKVRHESVAMQKIQDRRRGVVVPGGRRLHEYVNLYVCARNPMLFKTKDQHADLCVLRVSPKVLHLPGVVVTDGNASSGYTRFAAAPGGLALVDRDQAFAEDWRDKDQIAYWRKKSAKCAEVLVPDAVAARLIVGAYVSGAESKAALEKTGFDKPITVDAHMFFR